MPGFTVGGIEIGGGTPKIAVSVFARTQEELLLRAQAMRGEPFELLEWRADIFACPEPEAVCGALRELRRVLPGKLLIFTLRTAGEGGECRLPFPAYARLNAAAASSGLAEFADVELGFGEEALRPLLSDIHAAGARAIVSSHEFARTPPKEELIRRFLAMQALGADIAKIAVMPQTPADVLTLLQASEEMRGGLAGRPFIAISMGALGALSRVACALFGSAVTFGAAGEASAPGQIPVRVLAAMLRELAP